MLILKYLPIFNIITILKLIYIYVNNKMINEEFIESNMKSPINNGMFKIFISRNNKKLFKKIITPVKNIFCYKKLIYESINNDIIRKFIHKSENIYIENDGSYYCEYITNGIRLYDINVNSNINRVILNNLIKCIKYMKRELNNYVKTKKLCGDWALHNLIYCLDTNSIYNVDIEGFYTYPHIHNNGNCNIKQCNERFDKLIDIIDKLNSKKNVKKTFNSLKETHEIKKNIEDFNERFDKLINIINNINTKYI